ncbi:molybdopterin synthase catalytic subunit [Diorhabda carinulata]|uniref:molybdopterin synthase catalytic subunit n=1 Tax=Diorhabda carinulata TaxID=1163345 RepID=UPI0025A2CE71|nr:molybdopterin synthase catalytic subunit [Diorhabda carinulata]
MNYLKITSEKLNSDLITNLVSSNSCGAISLFIGTTRDNFEGRPVEKLEYEAYESMCLKNMENICKNIRNQWPSIENIAIYHRLGLVPIKEASIIIGTSSPHRIDAIKATEFCINSVKESVPIWKKEYYKDDVPQWKENKEYNNDAIRRIEIRQNVEAPAVPHLRQVKATKLEVRNRINKFIERKRSDININNVREFCQNNQNLEFTCARIDATVHKRKDSSSHLQVNRVINSYAWRDQTDSSYLTKHIPSNGIEERLVNVEKQLSLTTPVPKNIYDRLKNIENRLLQMESVSPEYIQFWDKGILQNGNPTKKKIFTIEEIDNLIMETEREINVKMNY